MFLFFFLELKRVKSKEVKVAGISKTTIPTLFHPKVPYFSLVLEDEKGNKWAQKTFDEYRIGDEFKIEAKKDKDAVAVWRVKYDALEAIEKAVDLIGGIEVNQNSKILILPTLVSPKHPYFAENTSPEMLDGLIKFLTQREVRVENIKIASQSFDEVPIEISAQKSKLLEICLKNQIIPLDLSQSDFIKKPKDNFVFEISEEIFKQYRIINFPILNRDSNLGVEGAAHNILKVLKKESYFSLKYLYNNEEIIKNIQKVLPKYLNIGDGTFIQKSNGYTAFLGIILASFNPFHLDRVFADICMLENLPESIKSINIENIPVAGRKIQEVQYELEKI